MNFIRSLQALFLVIILSSGCFAALDEQKKVANLGMVMSPKVPDAKLDAMLYKPKEALPAQVPVAPRMAPRQEPVAPVSPMVLPQVVPAPYFIAPDPYHYDRYGYNRYDYGRRRWPRYNIDEPFYIQPPEVVARRVVPADQGEEQGLRMRTKVICGTLISGALCYFLYNRYYKKPFEDDKRCLERAIRIYQETPELLPASSYPILDEAIKRFTLMGRSELRDICTQLRDLTEA